MALRQIMIAKKIKERNASLEQLRVQIRGFETRKVDLTRAIEEAGTSEEEAAVEEEVATYEAELKEVQDKVAALETEVTELQEEMDDLNNNSPDNDPTPADPEERGRNSNTQTRGGESRMNVRFNQMSFEQRKGIAARSEVKDFLSQVRELGRTAQTQNRAVSGAELTVPDTVLGMIRDNLHRYSKLIKHVQVRRLKGTARQNIAGAIPEAVWTEACASLNELFLAFSQIEVDGYKVGGFVPICNATLEDSDENLAAEILDAISQGMGLAVDKAIPYGTGKKMPLGFAKRLAQSAKPEDWGKNAPEWADLRATHLLKINPAAKTAEEFFSELVLKLSAARANYSTGELFWAMSTTTKAQLMAKMVLFNAAGALVASLNNTMPLVGGEIETLDFIPDGDIIGGYGSLYLLAERAGMQFAQSEHVRFLEDQTVFKGTARYDGKPVFGEGFVIVNINNADPTTSVAFAPDTANPGDAYLSALAIGSLTLSPVFSATTTSYTTDTTNASNTVTATAAKDGAVVEIKLNGSAISNGAAATWTTGANTVEVKVTKGTTAKTYTVVVTKS